MSATIKKIKNNGNTIYPITTAKAVWVNNSKKLSDVSYSLDLINGGGLA